MTDLEAELYDRICKLKLDDPNSPYPMSAKLAWEYDWSEIYTLRAMVEYKKFVFLARVAEGMVAPSSTIDAVWHYHLLYTYSYWEELCAGILGKPLHHYPGDRGSPERYNYTLQLYQTYFDRPPADIWDVPPIHSYHLDRHKRYWRVPNPIYWGKKYLRIYSDPTFFFLCALCLDALNRRDTRRARIAASSAVKLVSILVPIV